VGAVAATELPRGVAEAASTGTWVDVRDFGAVGDGVADDSAAIVAAVGASGGRPLYFPKGSYRFSNTIPLRMPIVGEGRAASRLIYTGGGTALQVLNPGSRSYDNRIVGIELSTSTGSIGIDLDSHSAGYFENLSVKGFSAAGVWIHSPTSGWALYNVFVDVTVSSCTVGFGISGIASNEHSSSPAGRTFA
jgi:Pectate lyase superfamily protein